VNPQSDQELVKILNIPLQIYL